MSASGDSDATDTFDASRKTSMPPPEEKQEDEKDEKKADPQEDGDEGEEKQEDEKYEKKALPIPLSANFSIFIENKQVA